MMLHPGEEAFALAGDRIPGLVEPVVALVVALGIGWPRATRHQADRADHPARQHAAIGGRGGPGPPLPGGEDGPFWCEPRPLLHPENPPEQNIAAGPAPLGVGARATGGR